MKSFAFLPLLLSTTVFASPLPGHPQHVQTADVTMDDTIQPSPGMSNIGTTQPALPAPKRKASEMDTPLNVDSNNLEQKRKEYHNYFIMCIVMKLHILMRDVVELAPGISTPEMLKFAVGDEEATKILMLDMANKRKKFNGDLLSAVRGGEYEEIERIVRNNPTFTSYAALDAALYNSKALSLLNGNSHYVDTNEDFWNELDLGPIELSPSVDTNKDF